MGLNSIQTHSNRAIDKEPGGLVEGSGSIDNLENKNFIYEFSTDPEEKSSWQINGGADASLFKIGKNNGRLEFKSSPDFDKPKDKNQDNSYEIFVRATQTNSGFKADQGLTVQVFNNETLPVESITNNDGANSSENNSAHSGNSSDEIIYYTANCGPMTASGPLYPCNENATGGGKGSSNSANGQILPPSNINLTSDSRRNHNKYNEFIDEYNKEDDCDYAELAKGRALLQLDFEDNDTLAKDWNRNYASECELSKIII